MKNLPLICVLFFFACTSKQAPKESPKDPVDRVTASPQTNQRPITKRPEHAGTRPPKPDVGHVSEMPDAGKALPGRLCIKGPGRHEYVGKGSSGHDDQSKWKAKAKKVNQGLVFSIDGREVTVKNKTGAIVDNLDPETKYRVGVRFVTGGRDGGFRLVFPEGESDACAYFNGFYDNWRIRPVGRRGCGPCGPQ